MNAHDLKCWPEYFEKVKDGTKTFEIRKNDRNFQVGDTLELREFIPCKDCNGVGRVWSSGDTDPCGCKSPHGKYTGKFLLVKITYMTDFAQQNDYVVMSIKKVI